MDEKLRLALGDAARAARLRLGLTQAEVAKKVGLKPAVYGRVERGGMTPSVPTLRRMCTTLGLSPEVLLSLGESPRKKVPTVKASSPARGEHPELSRIIHLLQGWSPERLAFLRKLLEMADSHFPK
jgi:transcriptional regulator with XRE-family HTH domain